MIDQADPADTTLPALRTTILPLSGAGALSALRAHALDLVIGVGLFVASLGVYDATLTPSLSYLSPDGNELATIPYVLGLAHSTGYPLYTWLGKLFTYLPIGDVAHRVNLMSAVMGAGGVAILYGILLIVLGEQTSPRDSPSPGWRGGRGGRSVAAAVALIFAFSPSFWSQTGIAEVYAPNLFMVALQLLLLLQWARVEESEPADKGRAPTGRSLAWFAAFCLTFALSTGTHSSDLGFGLGYGVFVLLVNWRFALKPRALLVGIGAFVLGMLQHLWLPYKAGEVFDPIMARNEPNTWQGFYNYTLGAFKQMKFAFTLAQVPDRIVIYLNLLRQQFSVAGILVGILGMYVLLFRQTKRWWLLALMYLVHVVFFTQYRVFDLDVFFIPAHFLFAIFMAVGVSWAIGAIWRWLQTRGAWFSTLPSLPQIGLAALIVIAPAGLQLASHWEANDRSGDVAINDFYQNVWELLPPDSVLMGHAGVFGYDAFYWRLVYNIRPDVLITALPGAERSGPQALAGRAVFSTLRAEGGRGGGGGPWGISPEMVSPEAWYIPVLIGSSASGSGPMGRQVLALYAVSETPPALIVAAQDAHPQNIVNQPIGDLTLLGADLDTTQAQPGGRIHLKLYWQQIGDIRPIRVGTTLGETTLETHPLGLDNLERYIQTVGATPGGVIVEDYWIVIPSTLGAGEWPLVVLVGDSSLTVGQITLAGN